MFGKQALFSDIHVITAEINAYQRVAGEAIFEIGRRLKHVKENDLAHGEFGRWCESIGMSRRVAQKAMNAVDKLSEKASTYSHMGLNALDLVASLEPNRTQSRQQAPPRRPTK
jgi:Protein of unknown function (DUF3102)